MMNNNECRMYDYIVECGIATAEELNLARNLIYGTWEEVMNNVIYVRTGYETFNQWIKAEAEEE